MGSNAKNPNATSKRTRSVTATKKRKVQMKKAYDERLQSKHNITKAAARKGAKPGLLPTSGSGAAISKKKQRKLERKLGYALKRKMAGEGEVEMKGRLALELQGPLSMRY
jgi:hypothetical protein